MTETATKSFVDFVESVLDDKRAEDLVRLDVSGITDLADEFLIATISTRRQGTALVETVEQERQKRGVGRVGIEGNNGSSWIIMDYGDFVVHLFLPEPREYYALEHLWADAKRVR